MKHWLLAAALAVAPASQAADDNVFRYAFDPCVRPRLVRHDRLPSFPM